MGPLQISRAAITCLALRPSSGSMPPMLVANVMESTLCVLKANENLTNFTVLQRLRNPHKLLPLQCCHLPSLSGDPGDAGCVATASEDSNVRVFNLGTFKERSLQGHTVPVVGVAVSADTGLLVSGDVKGVISLWRPAGDTSAE